MLYLIAGLLLVTIVLLAVALVQIASLNRRLTAMAEGQSNAEIDALLEELEGAADAEAGEVKQIVSTLRQEIQGLKAGTTITAGQLARLHALSGRISAIFTPEAAGASTGAGGGSEAGGGTSGTSTGAGGAGTATGAGGTATGAGAAADTSGASGGGATTADTSGASGAGGGAGASAIEDAG